MDEAMFLMRKLIQKFPTIFPQDVVLFNDLWAQLVAARYKAVFSDNKSLKNWKFPEELLQYCWGITPSRGRIWSGAKFLYAPFNVENKHWMGMCIDIKHGHIHLFNCDHACYTVDKLKPFVEPF